MEQKFPVHKLSASRFITDENMIGLLQCIAVPAQILLRLSRCLPYILVGIPWPFAPLFRDPPERKLRTYTCTNHLGLLSACQIVQ